jgi:hypothetical protein
MCTKCAQDVHIMHIYCARLSSCGEASERGESRQARQEKESAEAQNPNIQPDVYTNSGLYPFYSESIRSYGNNSAEIHENLEQARRVRRYIHERFAEERMGDLLTYSRGENPASDLDIIIAASSAANNIARTQKGKGVVMLQSKQCMKYGLIQYVAMARQDSVQYCLMESHRNRQTTNTVHYCTFAPSGSRKVTTNTDWSQVVVYPWQLLSNPTLGVHFHQVLAESNDELWQSAVMSSC